MTILGITLGVQHLVAAGAGVAFLEALARLTPNDTDNKIVGFLGKLLASLNIRYAIKK